MTLFVVLLLSGVLSIATDDGTGIDPHGGGVQSAACTDEGVGLDPFGRPCTTQTVGADRGFGIDPNG